MEATGDRPQVPPDPTNLPRPLPGAGGQKPKAARCLGLAPPLRPSAAAGVVAAAAGDCAAVDAFILPTPTARKEKKKRVSRDPAAKAACKRTVAGTPPTPAAMAPMRPAATVAPSPSPATAVEHDTDELQVLDTDELQVLDEMPASLNNEDFMNSCGVANDIPIPPSQEFEQEESEGWVDPNARKGRGINFTKKEDQALCNAWRKIGHDAIVGNEQQSSSYWLRIHELYTMLLKGDLTRTPSSLQARFQTINADCFRWSCCLAQVDRLNPSGTSDTDKTNIAQTLFKDKANKKSGKEGKAFTLHHCWEILEHDEKWKNRPSNEIPNKRKKKPPSTSVGEGLVLDTDDDGSSSPTPLSSVNRGRPQGRKKAKNKRANEDERGYKDSLDNMMEVRKDIAMQRRELKMQEIEERRKAEERRMAAEERRAMAEERRAIAEEKLAEIEERKVAADEMSKRVEHEQRIMFMDPSGLDDKGRAYLELCRDQILASRGYFPTNGGNGGAAI